MGVAAHLGRGRMPTYARRQVSLAFVGLAFIAAYWTAPLLLFDLEFAKGVEAPDFPIAFQFLNRTTFSIRWLVAAPLIAAALARTTSSDGRSAVRAGIRGAMPLGGVVGALLILSGFAKYDLDTANVLLLLVSSVTGALLLYGISLAIPYAPARIPVAFSKARASGEARSGGTSPDPLAIRAGDETQGRYVVEAEIGRGSNGVTFAAWDSLLERRVALKMVSARGSGPAGLDAVLQEARTAGALSSPRIVRVHDLLLDGSNAYLVMEYAPGGSLADALAREGRLRPERTVRVALAVLDALEVAHANGILHRDVKPANVLFDERGEAMLGDFGIALLMDARSTLAGFQAIPESPIGTLAYMAPEQLEGGRIDARADLHAVGALLHEMATGRPYLPLTGRVVHDRALILTESPDLSAAPAWLRDVLAKGLARAPEERFATAREFKDALRAAALRARSAETSSFPE